MDEGADPVTIPTPTHTSAATPDSPAGPLIADAGQTDTASRSRFRYTIPLSLCYNTGIAEQIN